MGKPVTLSVEVNGGTHTVEVKNVKKQYLVSIDGQYYNAFNIGKCSSYVHNEDLPIEVQGEFFILAIRGSKVRLAKNGVYTDNGEVFSPAMPPPKWVWIFTVMHVLFFLFVVGGAVGGGFAGGGAIACVSVAQSGKSTMTKVIHCILITVGCWVCALIIAGIIINTLL